MSWNSYDNNYNTTGSLSTTTPSSLAGVYADQTTLMDMECMGLSYSSIGLTTSQADAVYNGTAQIDWSSGGSSSGSSGSSSSSSSSSGKR